MKESSLWRTPDGLYSSLNFVFRFELDAAANQRDHKCRKWFGPGGIQPDALKLKWHHFANRIFVNPPYHPADGPLIRWVLKMHQAANGGAIVVAILPATTNTRWFQDYIKGQVPVFVPRSRIKFLHPFKESTSARHDSMICFFGVNPVSGLWL